MKIITNGSLPEAAALIPSEDISAFSLLETILSHTCDYIASDMENYIICTTVPRFPVWIWTKSGIAATKAEEILSIIRNDLPDRRYFNIKESFLDVIASIDEEKHYSIGASMLSYDCPETIAPTHSPDGSIRTASITDLDTIVDMTRQFFIDIGEKVPDDDALVETEKHRIEAGNTYLWITADGRIAAKCSCDIEGAKAHITGVFTAQDLRRHGYAEQIVYRATEDALAKGLHCSLYTDADYPASNACYMNLGYICRGALVTAERT